MKYLIILLVCVFLFSCSKGENIQEKEIIQNSGGVIIDNNIIVEGNNSNNNDLLDNSGITIESNISNYVKVISNDNLDKKDPGMIIIEKKLEGIGNVKVVDTPYQTITVKNEIKNATNSYQNNNFGSDIGIKNAKVIQDIENYNNTSIFETNITSTISDNTISVPSVTITNEAVNNEKINYDTGVKFEAPKLQDANGNPTTTFGTSSK